MSDVVKDFIKGHWKYLLGLALVLALCFLVYQNYNKPQPVTGKSQQQAETPQGVDLAAHNAQVDMLQSQLQETARQIAALANKKPDTIVQTVPVQVPYVVEQQR